MPPDAAVLPADWERTRVLDVLRRAVPPRLALALAPFERGLRRRLARDQDRLHAYHNDLYREAMRRAAVATEGDRGLAAGAIADRGGDAGIPRASSTTSGTNTRCASRWNGSARWNW